MTTEPEGVAVVVWRRSGDDVEFLLLHRAHWGPEFAGDWAWSSPGGAREPAETPEEAAARELEEETGLALPCLPTPCTVFGCPIFHAEVSADATITLSPEHDGFAWLPVNEARRRSLPEPAGEIYASVAEFLDRST